MLDIGVILSGRSVPRWQRGLLEQLVSSDFLRTSILRIGEGAPADDLDPRSLLFRGYERLDRALMRRFRGSADAMERVDAEDLIRAVSSRGPVDLILQLDDRSAPVSPPRLGVWRYRYDELSAFARGDLVTTQKLLIDRAIGPSLVAYESSAKLNALSLNLNHNVSRWKAAEFVLRALSELHASGEEYFAKLRPATGEELRPEARNEVLDFFARLARNAALRGGELALFDERWFVAVRSRRAPGVPAGDLDGFVPLMPPRDRFYADPFLLEHGARTYLFFEDYRRRERKGLISYVVIEQGRPVSDVHTAMEAPHHLSYPFVFEYRDQFYLVPESRSQRRIELHRAVRVPDQWELEAVLLDGINAVDPTLFEHGGRWWMFANVAVENASSGDELWLFYADTPLGPWTRHPKSPIVSSVRSARPAGRVFSQNGCLIRPGQDSALRYGHRIVLNEIRELSTTNYVEIPIGTIEPNWFPKNRATHTYDVSVRHEVLDGCVLIPRRPGRLNGRR